jgi:hypothetical protein
MSGDIKDGDAVKRVFELRVDMYTETVDGVPNIVYTREPYNLVLGGVPMAPNFSNNI